MAIADETLNGSPADPVFLGVDAGLDIHSDVIVPPWSSIILHKQCLLIEVFEVSFGILWKAIYSKFFRIPPKAGFGETLQAKSHSESKAFETCLRKESFLGLHPLHPHSGGHNASTSAGIERMSLLRQLLDADGKSMADVRASIQHLAGTSSLKLPFFRRSWGVQLVGLGTRYETLILWPVSQHTRQTGRFLSLPLLIAGRGIARLAVSGVHSAHSCVNAPLIYDDLRLAAIEAILDDTATLLGNHQGPGLESHLLMTSHFHVTKYHWVVSMFLYICMKRMAQARLKANFCQRPFCGPDTKSPGLSGTCKLWVLVSFQVTGQCIYHSNVRCDKQLALALSFHPIDSHRLETIRGNADSSLIGKGV